MTGDAEPGDAEPGRPDSGDPGNTADTGPRTGDAHGTIDTDEGGESPCLAHLVDDPPALPDDRLAQLVTRLADATSRAGRDGIDRA